MFNQDTCHLKATLGKSTLETDSISQQDSIQVFTWTTTEEAAQDQAQVHEAHLVAPAEEFKNKEEENREESEDTKQQTESEIPYQGTVTETTVLLTME